MNEEYVCCYGGINRRKKTFKNLNGFAHDTQNTHIGVQNAHAALSYNYLFFFGTSSNNEKNNTNFMINICEHTHNV